jgi:hypothetical protein
MVTRKKRAKVNRTRNPKRINQEAGYSDGQERMKDCNPSSATSASTTKS